MTSIGLVFFCAYDLVIVLRRTPESAFIMDDLLIHLALVPGGLSLLGYLLGQPDLPERPRRPARRHLAARDGLPRPLRGGCGRLQPAAVPLALPRRRVGESLRLRRLVRQPVRRARRRGPAAEPGASGPGVELFVMLAGVVTTMSFLLVQARLHTREVAAGAELDA